MVCVVAIALGLSTYAWFASNNSAKAEKMNVTATADVKFLEIQNAKGTIKKHFPCPLGLLGKIENPCDGTTTAKHRD